MMKTSFTKLFREKWKAIVPMLFFCTMSIWAHADDFAPCGNLDSISQVTVSISCDGDITFSFLNAPESHYTIGVEGCSATYDATGTSYTITHGTTALDTCSGNVFSIVENCMISGSASSGTTFYGVLPDWSGRTGIKDTAAVYMYTDSTHYDGKSVGNARQHDVAKDIMSVAKPTVTVATTKPSCPDSKDGTLKLTLDLDATKCATGVRFKIFDYDAASYISADPWYGPDSFDASAMITIDTAKLDTFYVVFESKTPEDGCICGVPAPDRLEIRMPLPDENDASIACIDRINVSSSPDAHDCHATIKLTDVMLGVSNPCRPENDSAEYIIVKDKATGKPVPGTYLDKNLTPLAPTATKGYAFTFDADLYFGREVIVEVHDEMSGNHCWGTALIEDKAPPKITCEHDSLRQVLCIDFKDDLKKTLEGKVKDCSPFDVTVVRSKTIPECNDTVLKQIEMVYFAEDVHGRRSETCHDTLQIMSIAANVSASDDKTLRFIPGITLHAPEDKDQLWNSALSCNDYYDKDEDGAPDPVKYSGGAGYPYIVVDRSVTSGGMGLDTIPLPAMGYQYYGDHDEMKRGDMLQYCKIGAAYQDVLIGKFDCITKYMRNWTVYHWSCYGELDTSFQQIIEIADTIPPSFAGHEVADAEITVNSHSCSAVKQIKMPEAWDNCSDPDEIHYQAIVYNSEWEIIGPDINDGYEFDFPYGRNYVVYTAFDACHRAAKDTAIVDVVDKTPPVTVCKEFLVVGISNDGTVRVPATSFDNYSYDDCGLKSICVVRMDDQELFDGIDAEDAYPNDGWILLSALEESEEQIACDRYDWYADRAVDTVFGDKVRAYYLHRDHLCQKEVWFCCADDKEEDGDTAGTTDDVMVILRAEDHSGNRNECMVFVDIQDKTRPTITCPPAVTVDCELPMPVIPEENIGEFVNIDNDPLTALFGSIVGHHLQEKFGVHPSHIIYPEDHENLVDGTWYDNCDDPTIYVKTDINFDQCRTGYILRTFYAEDASGNRSDYCTQRIDIKSEVEFDIENVIWPVEDTILTTCMREDDITATMFGVPSAPEGACMLFGTSYEDKVFRFNNRTNPNADACFKLIRKWSVIDWCSHREANGSQPYSIDYTQVIKVVDSEAPEVTCREATPVETLDCDGATVELSATSSDECTPAEEMYWDAKVDIDNDGTYEYGLGSLRDYFVQTNTEDESIITMTRKWPLGTHKITWISEDRCGNVETCSTTFTVTLTKAPTPFATNVSTVLMSTGMVEIWASDLDNKSEGACGVPVKVGIVRASADTLNGANIADALTFTCADYVNGPSVDINFYAYHEIGGTVLKDFTTVTVTLQDNSGACDDEEGTQNNTSAVISGSIQTASSVSVQDIEIGLLGGNQGASLSETKTNRSGTYAFPAMAKGGAYKIDPVSSDDYLNGVSTLDLVLIQRYVLGLGDLETPYQIIAADINKDGKISASDLAALRSTLLGRTDAFRGNDSWRFLDASYTFRDEANPLGESFPESYDIAALDGHMTIDFVGIKVGDIDGSVDAAGVVAHSRSVYTMNVEDQTFSAGDLISVPMRASAAVELLGMQFTSTFDAAKLAFAGIESDAINVTNDNVGLARVADGIITASWNDVVAQAIASDDAVITINFKALAAGMLSESFAMSSAYTDAEMYDADLQTMTINMAYNNASADVVDAFTLYQNTPNPFAEATSISFYLPQAGTATLKVYDVTGKVLKLTKGSFDRGMNTIEISKAELAASGVLYYTLETADFTDTKRMVVLK